MSEVDIHDDIAVDHQKRFAVQKTLRVLDAPRSALLFFNIGIELGQLAFILGILVLWFASRGLVREWQGRLPQVRLQPIPVYVLGALSVMWCIERGLDVL